LEEKEHIRKSLIIPAVFVLTIWIIKIIESLAGISFVVYGVYPGDLFGLVGILTFPLIHGSWEHLLSNTFPVLFLSMGVLYFYKSSGVKVLLLSYFIPGICLWLFARESYHIGASAVIYSLVSYLFFSGIIRRDKRAITLALIVTFFYGGLVWGILPLKREISWEGHLFGALTGIAAAIIFRKKDPYKRYDWEDEDDDDDNTPPEKLEISYKKGYPFE
jgi:membrane associated rhomboid family serine protease